jgi:hypothetical protein
MNVIMQILVVCAFVTCRFSAIASVAPPLQPPFRRRLDGTKNNGSSSLPKIIQSYSLWDSSLISKTLLEWAEHYPEFVRVTTAQDAYKLPRAGNADDCPFDKGGNGCYNYIVTIQDFLAHPEDSESSKRLPEVL